MKRIYSICVNDKLNFLSQNGPGTNHKYKRDVSDELLKYLRRYDTDFPPGDNSEDFPLEVDKLPEENTESFDNSESESPLTDTEPDEDLKILWDYESPEEFNDWTNETPMPIEDGKQSPIIHEYLAVTTTETVSKRNNLEENLKKLFQRMLNSVKKQPSENSLLHDKFDSSDHKENSMSIDSSLNEHSEKIMDFSHTESAAEIDWEGTTAESVTAINLTYLLKFIQDMIRSQNHPRAKSSFEVNFVPGTNDTHTQKTIVKDNTLTKGNGQGMSYSRTKSPIELEWDKASIESLINEDQMTVPTEKIPVAAKNPTLIIPNKKPEWNSDMFQNMTTVEGGIGPNKHDFDDQGSLHNGESLFQVHLSNDEHEKHIYEDSDDHNADYMDTDWTEMR